MNGVSPISLTMYLYILCYVPSFDFDSPVITHIFLVFLCFLLRAVYCSVPSGNAVFW
jgi:hypothetical protein